MAHTPVFAQLQRMVRRQRAAEALHARTGVPVAEWLAPGRSRRDVLALLASAGAIPFVGCGNTSASGSGSTGLGDAQASTDTASDLPKGGTATDSAGAKEVSGKPAGTVAIVGGGLAGLHCALRLWQDYGIASTVYETQARTGGRCWTDRDTFAKLDGMHCELGGEFIDSGHPTALKLCKAFGLPLLDYQTDDKKLSDWLIVEGKIWSEFELLQAWKPLASAIGKAQQSLKGGQMPTFDQANGGEALDKQSLADWLDAQKVTGALRTLIDVAYTGEFGLDPADQSMLNLLDMAQATPDALAVIGSSDERYHVQGGNDALVQKMVAALPAGAVKTGHTLQKAAKNSDGRILLTFSSAGGAVEVKTDHAIFALPFTALRKVDLAGLDLPKPKAKCIAELGYGTNSKLMVGFKSRIWRKLGNTGAIATDVGFQQCWDTSRMQSPKDLGILTNYSGGQHGDSVGLGSAGNQRDAWLNQLDALLTGAKVAATSDVVRQHWKGVPWVEGSYCVYGPGQFTSIRGAEAGRVGNLHFCGEHTDLVMQGYLEGALASGERAALELAGDLGIAAAPAG